MQKAGFEDIIEQIPGGEGFWTFLNGMVRNGVCTSCKEGGGNPGCEVRICAKERGVDMCAFCDDYPCELFDRTFTVYRMLREDNEFLRRNGVGEWLNMQTERRSKGFTYSDGRS